MQEPRHRLSVVCLLVMILSVHFLPTGSRGDSFYDSPTVVIAAGEDQSLTLLRRLYLCLIGMPPTIDEVETYLSQPVEERYQNQVQELLRRPEFIEHWAEKFDVLLMERRANTHVPQDQWMAWLRSQIESDRPMQEWLADLISSDGIPGEQRPAARFLLDRAADPHLITRDIGRIFFGRDVQCAQCHNHPSVDSYLQTDYYGLFGFVSGLQLVEVAEGESKIQVLGEKNTSQVPFESVFRRGTMHLVQPHLFGEAEIPTPWSTPGNEYLPAEKEGYPQKPVFSPRQHLAESIRTGNLELFNRNLANRIWGMAFGSGLVDPPDWTHAANPALSEKKLDTLTEQLIAKGFRLRPIVEAIVTSTDFRRADLLDDATPEVVNVWQEKIQRDAPEQLMQLENRLSDLKQQRDTKEKSYHSATRDIAAVQLERLEAFSKAQKSLTDSMAAKEAADKAQAETLAAKKSVDSANEKVIKLEAANQAAESAKSLLGEDGEFHTAVAVIQQRVTAAREQLSEALQNVVNKQLIHQAAAANATALLEELAKARKEADEVNERFQIAAQNLQSLREEYESAVSECVRVERMFASTESLSKSLHDPQLNGVVPAPVRRMQEVASQYFLASRLYPQSPEQLGWSYLSVNGIYRSYVNKHLAELEKEQASAELDESAKRSRVKEAVRRARAELQGNIQHFVQIYGSGAGQPQGDFFATADQALYVSNGGALFSWAAASGDNVTNRIAQEPENHKAATILYRGILCRDPTPAEVEQVDLFLKELPDQRSRLAQEMVWSLMVSAEFRFIR